MTCNSRLACESQRSSHALDRAASSASMEERLPQEMLEAILGKLDRETLCTVRLVSRTLCAAASAVILSLTLRSPSQAVTLERFPCVEHVTVHHIGDGESLARLDPRLRAVISHLTYSDDWASTRMTLPELPGMPQLRELNIEKVGLVDGAAVLHRIKSLEVLRIGSCIPSVAMTISTMTWLTSLDIGEVTTGEGWRSQDFSWLQHATNLSKLQALQISVPHEALPLIGNLTGLTGLTWRGGPLKGTCSIAPLSRLCRLRSLNIASRLSDGHLAIACSLGSGSLAKLCLRVGWHASADCLRLLARQTALTHLQVGGEQTCNLQDLGAMRMELLQFLKLPRLRIVDAEGLNALEPATSLTQLHISMHIQQPDMRHSQTLGGLRQLRALQLEFHVGRVDTSNLDLRVALGPLTALTKLQISRTRLGNEDWQALLGLTILQVLELDGCPLTDAMVPELAVLTKLRCLKLCFCGVTSLAPVTNILNPLRQARGWPPVDASCK